MLVPSSNAAQRHSHSHSLSHSHSHFHSHFHSKAVFGQSGRLRVVSSSFLPCVSPIEICCQPQLLQHVILMTAKPGRAVCLTLLLRMKRMRTEYAYSMTAVACHPKAPSNPPPLPSHPPTSPARPVGLCVCVCPFCSETVQVTFKHGTFEKVNYLGYDDHVVLDRGISFLLDGDGDDFDEKAEEGEDGPGVGGGGKLLTILTVCLFVFRTYVYTRIYVCRYVGMQVRARVTRV